MRTKGYCVQCKKYKTVRVRNPSRIFVFGSIIDSLRPDGICTECDILEEVSKKTDHYKKHNKQRGGVPGGRGDGVYHSAPFFKKSTG